MNTKFNFSHLVHSLNELTPKKAKFCLNIERFLKKELLLNNEFKQSQVILGVSGGVDSLALLFILYFLKNRLGYDLSIAHLNHNLRLESELEANWVKKLAEYLNIPYFSQSLDINKQAQEQNIGVEEAGRKARYAFFANIAKQYTDKTVFISTAHHLDDLAEEVLLRMIRGTGWTALAGMHALKEFNSDYYLANNNINKTHCLDFEESSNKIQSLHTEITNYKIYLLRPVLLTPKSTLIDFMQSLNCSWFEDSSNSSLAYKRNRVRNLIMPLILEENPNFREKIAHLWRLARIDESFWNNQINNQINLTNDDIIISYDSLLKKDKAFRLRLYKKALESLNAGEVLSQTLFKLDEAVVNKQTGKEFIFSNLKIVKLIPDGLIFYLKNKK